MMRSLFSGVTGLRTHQTRMDVIGNNIANVNTVGYKKSAVTFKDLYSETVSASAAPSGDGATGGVNPKQIGLGVTLNSITTIHTPGSASYTGNPMDVAISGDGFFTVLTPTGYKYTRAGNFTLDTAGNLVTADGYYVQTVSPTMSSDTMLLNNGVKTDGLLVANSVFSEPTSNIHTGNVTADLAGVIGNGYGFEYRKDGGRGFVADINKNYQVSTTATLPAGVSFGVDKTGMSDVLSTLDMQAIADAYINQLENDPSLAATPGAKNVTFGTGTAGMNTVMIMYVDGVAVAQSGAISAVTAAGQDQLVKITFTSTDGNNTNIGAIDITVADGSSITVQDQTDAIIGLKSVPTIPLAESGSWWLMENGVAIEKVKFDGKTASDGVGIAAGEILFTTQTFGAFRLKLDTPQASMSDLSTQLSSAKFTVDVTREAYVIYESPTGEIAQSSLKTLQVDFSRYMNLSIDSKGAVIAQLKSDELINVDGRDVQMKMGDKVVLGYIPLANFNNTAGLEKVGDNLYEVGADSGAAAYGMPGSGTAGALSPSSQEMSNVDLSEEMVNMIITQRGFQANSRIITVSDTMLEELINLKR